MRKIAGFTLAAALVAAGLGLWSNSNLSARSNDAGATAAAVTISAHEIHLRTDVKDLPIQVNEDAF